MPDTSKRIDDRTFFILYALTKQPDLRVPTLSALYGETPFNEICIEFDNLKRFEIETMLTYAPSEAVDMETLEKIKEYETEIKEFLTGEGFAQQTSIVARKLVPYAAEAQFICKSPERLQEKIDEYFTNSESSRKLYFYNYEKHLKIFEEVNEWAITGMTAPYKIGFDRFLQFIHEKNISKYAFFHFLYQLEKSGSIKISELSVQGGVPLIIFETLKQKIHKPVKKEVPQGRELAHFQTLHLYENGIIDTAQDGKFFRCDTIEARLFEMFFRQPYQNHSYRSIESRIGVYKEMPKRISKARIKLQRILKNNNKKYFINNQKNKTYKFTQPD